MIKRGHVKSFQEFFHLTHVELNESQKSEKSGNYKTREDDVWASGDYKKIKQLLMEAEEAQLKGTILHGNVHLMHPVGSLEDTFLAKEKVAGFYEDRGDVRHATMHYTAAFTVASKIDPKHYTEGALRLGKTLERQTRFDDALRIYQQVFEFAQAKELNEDVSIIAGRIIECLLHHGQSLEATAVDKAIGQYHSAVDIAEKHCEGDRVVYSRIFHHLGLVHQKMGKEEEALKYLRMVLDNAFLIKDLQQEWLARSALANCFKRCGFVKNSFIYGNLM
jgi:tetratricopeptide (TPR) repeat protein